MCLVGRHYRSVVCEWCHSAQHLQHAAVLVIGKVYGAAYHLLLLYRVTLGAVDDVEVRVDALGNNGGR